MWKKDEIQETDQASQTQSEPKPPARSKTPRTAAAGDRAAIGRSITIKGDISGDEDLYIQGSVEGAVNLKDHNVTISSEGRIKADVHGRTITVQGKVEGDLFGEEQVILSPSCRLRGNITAPRVILEDGANFRGTIDMEEEAGGKLPGGGKATSDKPLMQSPTGVSSAAKAADKKP